MSRIAAAFHEAGHCVVAALKGIRTSGVTIKPTESDRGRWRYGPFPPAKGEAAIVAALAGLAAEKAFDPGTPIEVAKEDRAFCNSVFDHDIRLPDRAGYFVAREREAAELVGRHWPVIELVAKFLLEFETLPGRTVEALVQRCVEPSV